MNIDDNCHIKYHNSYSVQVKLYIVLKYNTNKPNFIENINFVTAPLLGKSSVYCMVIKTEKCLLAYYNWTSTHIAFHATENSQDKLSIT